MIMSPRSDRTSPFFSAGHHGGINMCFPEVVVDAVNPSLRRSTAGVGAINLEVKNLLRPSLCAHALKHVHTSVDDPI